jgi:hypothetical protein
MLVVVRTISYMLYIIFGRKYRNKIAARKHEKKIACYCQSLHYGFPTHMTILDCSSNSNLKLKFFSQSGIFQSILVISLHLGTY